MPKLKANQVPAYRLHRQSGQAIVALSSRDHLLGPYESPQSRDRYDRLIGEWLADGRRPDYRNAPGVTISRAIAEFWAHARTYYGSTDGTVVGTEADNFRLALKPLRRLYGDTPAADFGPRSLISVQQEMIRLGWARTHINRQLARIKQVFKWLVAQELVPPSVYRGLVAVSGLREGKSNSRKSAPVRPVPEEWVKRTAPYVSPQIATIIRV